MPGLQLQNKQNIYDELDSALGGLIEGGPLTWEAGLVSLIALLKQAFETVSWVGFYRNDAGHLWVGPYQGKLACVHLKPGQGVCGKSLETAQAIVVEDVHAFAGHVYCDPLARSEIVLPVFRGPKLVGVLDLDSHEPRAFDAVDQTRLERLLKAIEPLPDRVIL